MTSPAWHIVAHWGVSDKLGPIAFRRGEEPVFPGWKKIQQKDFSENTAQISDSGICSLIKGIEDDVVTLLNKNRQQLEALSEALLINETLQADEIYSKYIPILE